MDEPTNLMVITGIMEFDSMFDYSVLRALIEKRLLCHDRFRQRVVWPASKLGRPFWEEDPNFDIRNHIIRVALPTPRDKATLQRMISDLSVIPMDKTKPLWQVHVIENYGEGCVLFFRIHHAIADGIALIRLLLIGVADTEPNFSFAGARDTYEDERPRESSNRLSAAESLNLFLRATVNTSAKTAGILYNEFKKTMAYPPYLSKLTKLYGKIGMESATVLTKLLLMPSDSKTSLKGELGVQKSVCWSSSISVDSVKEIGQYFRCTMNDVLMAAISGALRQYLVDRGDDLDNAEVRMSIPVNVRLDSPKIELGNQFSIVALSLPVNLDDPVRRLRETRKRMRAIKESTEPFVGFQVLRLLGIPPKSIGKMGVNIFNNKFTGVLSNVPGPRQPLYLADKMIKNMMFWVPRSGSAPIGISIFSYAGSITLGIATDTHTTPDPEKIIGHFKKEFSQLIDLAKQDVLRRNPASFRASAQPQQNI
jgi:WS/DGAT/MGAT family acyltransferase